MVPSVMLGTIVMPGTIVRCGADTDYFFALRSTDMRDGCRPGGALCQT